MLRQTAVHVQRKMVRKEDQMISIVPLLSGVDTHPDTVECTIVTALLVMIDVD
jgi:hypothetical protein